MFLVLSFLIGIVAELQAFFAFNYWSVVVFEFLRGVIGAGAFPAAFTLCKKENLKYGTQRISGWLDTSSPSKY